MYSRINMATQCSDCIDYDGILEEVEAKMALQERLFGIKITDERFAVIVEDVVRSRQLTEYCLENLNRCKKGNSNG